jgi:two-component system, sensor histidine kinase and response regulator
MIQEKKQPILIIDDNPMNLLLTSRILENHGYSTSTAEDGPSGLEQIKNDPPALILLDVMMPEMDGYEVCRRIKEVEEWREIPVIFLTANSQTEELVEGFDAGGVDYITKPFRSEELLVRVKNHLELAASRKTILEMNRTRDKLYSIIAHDIRSPLSGILQTIDAIDQGYFDPCSEDFKELIHHLRIRTSDTSTLLNSLLQWTRIQGESIGIDPKTININELVSNCVQLLNANAIDKNISISIHIPDNATAWCDEVSVHTIFRNIISNAIKFTSINGTIEIWCNLNENNIEVDVRDSGVGMTDEIISKIFEKEEYYTSSGTLNEQGTGLGLLMVKDFIKKNKGKIEVQSILGNGTTVRIFLPKSQETIS